MGLFENLFGNRDRKLLLDTIEHNANIIEKNESRTRQDAEYLALCLVLDNLTSRPNGHSGRQIVIDILIKEYSQHHNDIMTHLAVQSGAIKLKPEAEKALMKRHQKQ